MKEDIWNTEFKNRSGLILPRDEAYRKIIDGRVGEYNCRGEEWGYRTWRVDGNGQLSGTGEIDSATIEKIISYCNKKPKHIRQVKAASLALNSPMKSVARE